MIITWPLAITIVGSIASLCLTLLKIIQMRKKETFSSNSSCKETVDKLNKLETKVAVIDARLEEFKADKNALESHLEKINDLLIKLLTDNRE